MSSVPKPRAALLCGAAVLSLLSAAGCSVETHLYDDDHIVTGTELAESLTNQLRSGYAVTGGTVTCDGSLAERDGATQSCRLTVNGRVSAIAVTVTDKDYGRYEFTVPSALGKDELARYLRNSTAVGAASSPDQVRCRGTLVLGGRQECAVASDGVWLPVTVTGTGPSRTGTVLPEASVGRTPIPEPGY